MLETTNEFKIIATGDIHGNYTVTNQKAGLAGIKSYQNSLTAKNIPYLYFDLGDALQGSPLAHYYSLTERENEHPWLHVMEELGCQGFVPGNHDFDYGLERLIALSEKAPFPFLVANIVNKKDNHPLFTKYKIFQHQELKIAVIGLSNRALYFEKPTLFADQLQYIDEAELLKKELPRLSATYQPDLIIVAYHGGLEKNPESGEELAKSKENKAVYLAEKFAEIDIILTSHQHKLYNTFINNCLIVQPGQGAKNFISITVKEEAESLEENNISPRQFSCRAEIVSTEKQKPAPDFAPLLKSAQKALADWQQKKLCALSKPIVITEAVKDFCLKKNILIDFLHYTQLQNSSAELSAVAPVNPDFTSTEMKYLTRKDIINFFPYRDFLVTVKLKGIEIKKIIEYSYGMFQEAYSEQDYVISPAWQEPHLQIYRFHLFSQLEYIIDFREPKGKRLQQICFSDKPLAKDRELTVVMSEYSYQQLKSLNLLREREILQKSADRIQTLLMKEAEKVTELNIPFFSYWKLNYQEKGG